MTSFRRQQFEQLWAAFDAYVDDEVTVQQDLCIGELSVSLTIRGQELSRIVLSPLRPRWVSGNHASAQIRVWSGPLPRGHHAPTELRLLDPGKVAPDTGQHEEHITAMYAPEAVTYMLWDSQSQRGIYWIEELNRLPYWEQSAPLIHLFHWLNADHGVALVHAAAVGRNGKGLLIVGPGGTGKSTSAIACLAAGWEYVSDDYSLLGGSHPPRAINLFGVGKLLPNSLEYFPELHQEIVAVRGDDDKSIFDFTQNYGNQVVDSLELVGVVLPQLGSEPQGPRNISRLSAAVALMPSTVFQLRTVKALAMHQISETLRALPSYAITFGPDRTQAPNQLGALLDELS